MSEVQDTLTPKQKKFADLYVGECNLNATRAAIAAGYSEKTARQVGSENLSKPYIRAYIEQQLNGAGASRNEVISVLSAHMKASVGDLLDDNGDFDLEKAKKSGVDRLIKKIKVRKVHNTKSDETETTYEIEIHDPQAAADKLAKIHNMYTERHEISGSVSTYIMSKDDWERETAKKLNQLGDQLEKFDE